MGRSSLTVASCACRLATAKVVVTDRLHGSIFAFLNGKPHIYIDQMYKKIERTREVAFRHSDACRQKKVLMYDAADGLQDAFLKAVRFLRQLEDEEPVTAEAGREGCVDSPGWLNSKGMSCARYSTVGYCVNGTIIAGKEWSTGSAFNFPEQNCCECGKLTAAQSFMRSPSLPPQMALTRSGTGSTPDNLTTQRAFHATPHVARVALHLNSAATFTGHGAGLCSVCARARAFVCLRVQQEVGQKRAG